MSRARDYLRLGRVSNLPTVWTNAIAGVSLGGASLDAGREVLLVVAFSLFYMGGMFLNDAFDAAIDARERPERPIPAGRVTAREAFVVGFSMLVAGISVIAHVGGLRGAIPAVLLGGAIVLYDAWHKTNPLSPLLMGLCRGLVYVTAAYATTSDVRGHVFVGASGLVAWVIGLTYVAKQEWRAGSWAKWPLALLAWPAIAACAMAKMPLTVGVLLIAPVGCIVFVVRLLRRPQPPIPRAVVTLIAGICLVDSAYVGVDARPIIAAAIASGFFVTLALQRLVRGT